MATATRQAAEDKRMSGSGQNDSHGGNSHPVGTVPGAVQALPGSAYGV